MDNIEESGKNELQDENVDVIGGTGNLFYERVKAGCNSFLEKFKIYKMLEQMASYLEKSPLLSCGLFSVLVGMATPIVLFVIFAVVSIAFVIIGFIILEGSILIIGTSVLSCSGIFVIVAAAVIGMCLLMFYLILCFFINLLKKFGAK